MTTEYWAPVVPLTARVHSLSDPRAVRVETTQWSEGSPSYSLVVETADGRSRRLPGDHDRRELDTVHARIARFLAGV